MTYDERKLWKEQRRLMKLINTASTCMLESYHDGDIKFAGIYNKIRQMLNEELRKLTTAGA